MSVHGNVGRRLTVLEWEWRRSIYDDRVELSPGWVLTITLPWIDIYIQNFGWKMPLHKRLRRRPSLYWKYGMFMAFGYELGFSKNLNTPHKYATGDATWLLREDD